MCLHSVFPLFGIFEFEDQLGIYGKLQFILVILEAHKIQVMKLTEILKRKIITKS